MFRMGVRYCQVVITLDQNAHTNNSSEVHDIFISYNTADTEFAERLVKTIEQVEYHGRNLRCFFAPWDIEPGESILLKIEKALSGSRFIGIIMSPEWLKSDWTTLERVVPVHDDPAGVKGRIIPILRRNCTIPPTIRILKWLDFRTESNFHREVRKLISRMVGKSYREVLKLPDTTELPTQSLDSIQPDFQQEILVSNLFQVLEIPNFIYRAHAKVQKRSEVWEMLGEGVTLPIFAIKEDSQEIYSFAILNNPQQKLMKLVKEPSTNRIPTTDLLSESNDSRVILIELLNRSMTAHMKNIGMVYDWKNKKTFFPLEKDGDEIRYSKWKVGTREYQRFVVQKAKSGRYYVHRSCKATFTVMGTRLFLKVLPGWHFTTDGLFEPVPHSIMSSLSAKWMNLQRNHSVLDDVRFWIYKLSRGTEKIEVDIGADTLLLVSSSPLSAFVDQGIIEDYRERLWLEEPSPDETEEMLIKEDLLSDLFEEEDEYE